jgi:galactosyl transferase GMA12/MNN10 family
MKIAVATLAVGFRYQRAVRLGIKSKDHYCRRHGYEFIYREVPFTDRAPSWDKIPLLSENIDRFEVIFWSDADVVIVNSTRRLEDIIGMFALGEDKAILIARDSADNVNAGNFFLFNRPSTQELLTKIWQQDQFIHHVWLENQAIIHLLESDPEFASAVHIEERNPNIFNAYCHVGDPARNSAVEICFFTLPGSKTLKRLSG